MQRDRQHANRYFDVDHHHADHHAPAHDVDPDHHDDHSHDHDDDTDRHHPAADDDDAEHDDACNHDAHAGYNFYGNERRSGSPGERDRH